MPPLAAPRGYAYSLSRLSDEILSRASSFYVWVTPEELRRRNIARTDPNDPGSILHHGVPSAVMLGDYGTDDMSWLMSKSDRPDKVRVEARGSVRYLPAVHFDNCQDRTSFVREEPLRGAPSTRAARNGPGAGGLKPPAPRRVPLTAPTAPTWS